MYNINLEGLYMSKFIYFLFAVVLFSFAGCSSDKNTDSLDTSSQTQVPVPTTNDDDEPITINSALIAKSQSVITDEDTSKVIRLEGSGTDENKLIYIISSPPIHGILTGNAPNITYIPDLDYNGEDSFTFKVSDGKTKSALATVNISIRPVNDAPTAVLKLKKGVVTIDKLEEPGFISGAASYDLDGKVVSYKFFDNDHEIDTTDSPTPCLNSSSCYKLSEGIHRISLVVIDNEGKQSINRAQVTLVVRPKLPENKLPSVNAGEDKSIKVNTSVRFDAEASDSDGIIVSYKWTEGDDIISTSPILNYTPTTLGEHVLKLTVTDNRWGTASDEVIVTATNAINNPPVIHTGENRSIEVGKSITLDANATDSDGTIVSYEWMENGELLGTDSTLVYVPDTEGEHKITLNVTDNDAATSSSEIVVVATKASIFECSATLETEESFTDTFVNENHDDIAFFGSKNSALSVKDIEGVFNYARSQDSTISTPLQMPSQNIWDEMSESQKALYLINSERCARGIRAFEAIAPQVVENVSQPYAQYIATHESDFQNTPHEADGRTPWQRLEEDANVVVNQNADFFQYAENLAYQAVGSSEDYPIVYAPTVKSIYAWLYEDKEPQYGHRNFILATGLNENSGDMSAEGLIGIGQAIENYTTLLDDTTIYWTRVHTVLNGFDPNENWDMSNIIKLDISEQQ